MYGLCMKEKNIYGKSFFSYNISKNDKLKPGFYNINWNSKMNFPILPHHNLITNKLLFTNGDNNGTYWFEEIELFQKMGGKISQINSGLIYEKYDYIFSDFVSYFEKFRQKNNTYKTLGKLMINSFYGRTGIKPKEEYSFFIMTLEELNFYINLSDKGEIVINSIEEINKIWFISLKLTDKTIKILLEKNHKIKKGESLNIAIASSITAKARVKLYKGFQAVQKMGGNILYSDTDSVIAEFHRSVDNEQHGEIFWDTSKKDTQIIDAVFSAPKTYAILFKNGNSFVKIKGVQRNYITFEEFKDSFYFKKNLVVDNLMQIKNTKFKVEYMNITKNIDLVAYDKRKFSDNLKETTPLYHFDGMYF